MQKPNPQDEEPDVDEQEQNKYPELGNRAFEDEVCHNPEERPENCNMLKDSNDKTALHQNLMQELGTRLRSKENGMQEEEDEPEEGDTSSGLNNNSAIKAELTGPETIPGYTQSGDGRRYQDCRNYDAEIIGQEEMMRKTRWSSLKKKVKDTLRRNSYSGCYAIAHEDKLYDGNVSQKYSQHPQFDLPNLTRNSQWYTQEVPKSAITKDERQKPKETTYPKHEHKCTIPGHDFQHHPGAVYSCLVHFEQRKYREDSGLVDCFISDPLKVLDGKICLKIQMNKRKEGKGCLAVKMCSAPEEDADFNLSHYPHRRTIVVGLPLSGPMTFVDEPPFGEELGQKWVDEVYWRSKMVPHKLIEKQENPSKVTIQIHLIMEPLCPLMQCWDSNDGVLNWKIRNYKQNLQDEKDGVKECMLSPYFYSHPQGYRLRARLFLNGTGPAKGSHMSVFLDFLAGQWDDCLPPSLTQFPHRTTFTILDQSENAMKLDHSRTEENNRGFGTGDFFYDLVPLSALQEELHFRRDTIVLRIKVKPIDLARDSTWKAPFVAPPKPPVPVRPSRN